MKANKTTYYAMAGIILTTMAMANRQTINLDGTWKVDQGSMEKIPAAFNHKVKVPGLLDLAEPQFVEVGVQSKKCKAFWYKKSFKIKGEIPDVALLKVNKAKYGTKVFLNGKFVEEHLPCFTPGFFNLKPFINGNNVANEIVIRIGANPESVPVSTIRGIDREKIVNYPGIYDSVNLILTDSPYIKRVQVNPIIKKSEAEVWTVVKNTGKSTAKKVNLHYEISEKKTGKIVVKFSGKNVAIKANSEHTFHDGVTIPKMKLWSDKTPFLYCVKVVVETTEITDEFITTFGMRKLKFNPKTNRAELNGKTTYLNGSNFCVFRFLEDPLHGDKIWNKKWVRKLHKQLKKMHWNSVRYCIGFPPEFWYDIADEEGIMIQDKFPIWHVRHSSKFPKELTVDCFVNEFAEWIHERANHPSVVIWDACNETKKKAADHIAKAIKKVRVLDKSNRPWENSNSGQAQPTDCFESHPYRFIDLKFKLSDLETMDTWPSGFWCAPENEGCNIIINEYAWLWLNRDGDCTKLSRKRYENILGKDATADEKREYYGLATAALTEFWRSYRHVAGVQHFCALGYSKPNGFTCDNWTDLESLEFEPHFFKYVSDAFSPVGLMLELWPKENGVKAGSKIAFNVPVINDTQEEWSGDVEVRIIDSKGEKNHEKSREYVVPTLGREYHRFAMTYPTNSGNYRIEAELKFNKDSVKSVREVKVK